MPERGGLFGQLNDLRTAVAELEELVKDDRTSIRLLEERVGGERGLSAAVNALAKEVASLRKAMYWVGGIIVAGAITFAFGVLALIPA